MFQKSVFTLHFKVLFMAVENASLQELRQIKQMMERSSRFSTLSGFSGVAAGLCSLLGAALVYLKISDVQTRYDEFQIISSDFILSILLISVGTFVAAAISAYFFIYLRCRRLSIPIFSLSARRVLYNMAIPIIIGALFILRLLSSGEFEMLAPASLLFYGLALINASKYTLDEIRQLGFVELAIGLLNLWLLEYGLLLWALGFGLMHIIWGIIIWARYERNEMKIAETGNE